MFMQESDIYGTYVFYSSIVPIKPLQNIPVVLCGNYHRKYHRKLPQDMSCGILGRTTGKYHRSVPQEYHRSVPQDYHRNYYMSNTTGLPQADTTGIPHSITTRIPHITTGIPHSNIPHGYHIALPCTVPRGVATCSLIN